MRWVDITFVPLSERYPEHFGTGTWEIPSERVQVIVAEQHRMAENWCREHHLPSPGRHSGAPIIVTKIEDTDRMRGLDFYDDDEILVLGSPGPTLIEVVKRNMAVAKSRELGPRPAARTYPIFGGRRR